MDVDTIGMFVGLIVVTCVCIGMRCCMCFYGHPISYTVADDPYYVPPYRHYRTHYVPLIPPYNVTPYGE